MQVSNNSTEIIHFLLSFNRSDEEFVKKNGKRKVFFTGSNSSCRQHIHQHYVIYQKKCEDEGIPEHHWAIPYQILREKEAEKRGPGKKVAAQGTLDG